MASVVSNPKDFEEEARKAREYYMYGDYTKGINFYKLAIDKLRRYCQTLSNAAEKKSGTQCLADLERELQLTIEHERIIGEIQENLLSKSTNAGGRVATGDAYSDLNNDDYLRNIGVDERPTRDPGFNNRNPAHGASPFPSPAVRFPEPRRDVRSANNNPRAKKVLDNKRLNNPINKEVRKKYKPVGAEKDLVEGLERDIVQKDPNVRWYVLSKNINMNIKTIE